MNIRLYEEPDWPQLWQILEGICRAGETYVFSREITEEQAKQIWIGTPQATYVAVDDDGRTVLGTYYLKSNFPGLGDHIANCGYAVAANAYGRGVASAMCEHSLGQARQRGFKAMQFNYVVSTNERAVKLWQRFGFQIIGVIPKGFRHARLGNVDVYIMHQHLEDGDSR